MPRFNAALKLLGTLQQFLFKERGLLAAWILSFQYHFGWTKMERERNEMCTVTIEKWLKTPMHGLGKNSAEFFSITLSQIWSHKLYAWMEYCDGQNVKDEDRLVLLVPITKSSLALRNDFLRLSRYAWILKRTSSHLLTDQQRLKFMVAEG